MTADVDGVAAGGHHPDAAVEGCRPPRRRRDRSAGGRAERGQAGDHRHHDQDATKHPLPPMSNGCDDQTVSGRVPVPEPARTIQLSYPGGEPA